ncbi:hypothetical protein BC829DRAFT_448463 [Chytridium lagenaria]|nr:hypothetical protein BC829DRAFT_448463 [Chytridium lagenaria]
MCKSPGTPERRPRVQDPGEVIQGAWSDVPRVQDPRVQDPGERDPGERDPDALTQGSITCDVKVVSLVQSDEHVRRMNIMNRKRFNTPSIPPTHQLQVDARHLPVQVSSLQHSSLLETLHATSSLSPSTGNHPLHNPLRNSTPQPRQPVSETGSSHSLIHQTPQPPRNLPLPGASFSSFSRPLHLLHAQQPEPNLLDQTSLQLLICKQHLVAIVPIAAAQVHRQQVTLPQSTVSASSISPPQSISASSAQASTGEPTLRAAPATTSNSVPTLNPAPSLPSSDAHRQNRRRENPAAETVAASTPNASRSLTLREKNILIEAYNAEGIRNNWFANYHKVAATQVSSCDSTVTLAEVRAGAQDRESAGGGADSVGDAVFVEGGDADSRPYSSSSALAEDGTPLPIVKAQLLARVEHQNQRPQTLSKVESALGGGKTKFEEDASKIFELFKSRKLVPTTEDIEIISREVVKQTRDLIEVHAKLGEDVFRELDGVHGRCKASWGIVKKTYDNLESSGVSARTALAPVDVAAPRVYTEVRWKDLKRSKGPVLLRIEGLDGRDTNSRGNIGFCLEQEDDHCLVEEEHTGEDDVEESTDVDDSRDTLDRDEVDDEDEMDLEKSSGDDSAGLDNDLDEEDGDSDDNNE